jgi:hypothetical protein
MLNLFNNQTCDRCKGKTSVRMMSMFNTDMCCHSCLDKERKHPKYKEAVTTEHEEVVKGNMNFPGIGLPDDLKEH